MTFDYRKLRGKIREVYGSESAFAKALDISNTSLSMKLNSHRDFTQSEINQALEKLRIREENLAEYFFTPKVQLPEQDEGRHA